MLQIGPPCDKADSVKESKAQPTNANVKRIADAALYLDYSRLEHDTGRVHRSVKHAFHGGRFPKHQQGHEQEKTNLHIRANNENTGRLRTTRRNKLGIKGCVKKCSSVASWGPGVRAILNPTPLYFEHSEHISVLIIRTMYMQKKKENRFPTF